MNCNANANFSVPNKPSLGHHIPVVYYYTTCNDSNFFKDVVPQNLHRRYLLNLTADIFILKVFQPSRQNSMIFLKSLSVMAFENSIMGRSRLAASYLKTYLMMSQQFQHDRISEGGKGEVVVIKIKTTSILIL